MFGENRQTGDLSTYEVVIICSCVWHWA